MSKYHEECTRPDCPKRKPPSPTTPIITKPFCDCHTCTCKDCPDILELLAIKVTDQSCEFGANMAKSSEKTCPKCSFHNSAQRSSLLDVISPERACACEVAARAVRADVHMNLGLEQKRTAANEDTSSCTSKDPTPK